MYFKWNKKSISSKLCIFMAILVLCQTILMIAIMQLFGVTAQSKVEAFDSFKTKVNSRASYIQREMTTHWSNISSYSKQIGNKITGADFSDPNVWEEVAPSIISMLRTTTATGAFIILNEGTEMLHNTLYLRDYAPHNNEVDDKDLYLIAGPFELSQKLNIPMDQVWSYEMEITDSNKAFYNKPLDSYIKGSEDPSLFGYWSKPFSITENDISIITYSQPLLDNNGNAIGVIGVEISIGFLSSLLPATDLNFSGKNGYILGFKGENEGVIEPIYLDKTSKEDERLKMNMLKLEPVNENGDIFRIDNYNGKENVFACIQDMKYYKGNTPFKSEEWLLVGLMDRRKLFSLLLIRQKIMMISLMISFGLSVWMSYIASRYITRPISILSNQVVSNDPMAPLCLSSTGIREIDELSSAIVKGNKELRESALQMSQIINMVDIPIGAFRYSQDAKRAFITDRLPEILNLRCDKKSVTPLMLSTRIDELLSKPEENEQDVFFTGATPIEWVRLRMVEESGEVLGVAMDMTNEMIEKRRICRTHDFDTLTDLYNRAAFQRQVEHIIEKSPENEICAMIMFDLDGLKQVNDTFGHRWGDIYIQETARVLNEFSVVNQLAGRRSGDEFYVFLYNRSDKDEVYKILDNFYIRLKTTLIQFPDDTMRGISISSGLAWWKYQCAEYDELLQCADLALYEAKQSGGNKWCEYKR